MTVAPDDVRPAMPPAVRRLSKWLFLPLPFVLAAPVIDRIPGLRDAANRPTPWFWYGVPATCAMIIGVMTIGLVRGQRRIRTALRAASGRACIFCLHDLSGLAEVGVCPECGREFDVAADRLSWSRVNMKG